MLAVAETTNSPLPREQVVALAHSSHPHGDAWPSDLGFGQSATNGDGAATADESTSDASPENGADERPRMQRHPRRPIRH